MNERNLIRNEQGKVIGTWAYSDAENFLGRSLELSERITDLFAKTFSLDRIRGIRSRPFPGFEITD